MRPLGCEYRKELGTLPHVEVLVVRAAPRAALPCSLLAPADVSGHPVHLIKRLFEGDQVRAGPNILPVLVSVVDVTQPMKVLYE